LLIIVNIIAAISRGSQQAFLNCVQRVECQSQRPAEVIWCKMFRISILFKPSFRIYCFIFITFELLHSF